MTTTQSNHDTKRRNVIVVGETRGLRAQARILAAEYYGVARSKVSFRQCAEHEADSEIARLTLNRWWDDGTFTTAVSWAELCRTPEFEKLWG